MSSRPDIRSLSEQTCQVRNQLDPDQYDSTTSHELFDPLALCARVIVPVTFKQVITPTEDPLQAIKILRMLTASLKNSIC